MTGPADDNPYAALPDDGAPPARAAPESAAPRRFSVLAVFVGTALDIGASRVIAWTYQLGLMIHVGPGADAAERFRDAATSFPHRHVVFVLGAAMSVLGGFVNGVIARRRELAHGVAESLLTMAVVTVLRLGTPTEALLPAPAWLLPLSYALVVPTVLLGSHLAAERRRRLESSG